MTTTRPKSTLINGRTVTSMNYNRNPKILEARTQTLGVPLENSTPSTHTHVSWCLHLDTPNNLRPISLYILEILGLQDLINKKISFKHIAISSDIFY